MDSLSEGTPDEGDGLSLNQLTTNSLWPTTTAANGNNSTLLYIAVSRNSSLVHWLPDEKRPDTN